MNIYKLVVKETDEGKRLDAVCAAAFTDLSREYIKKIINSGGITVDSILHKASYKVKPGETVELLVPEPEACTIEPENIPLEIVYEDHDVMVVNKPKGMVVHPAPGNYTGTLVNALLYHTTDLSGINGIMRPGILHRIDKDTTGLLMVAKNDTAHHFLAERLKEHSIDREYIGLAKGIVKEDKGTIDLPLDRHPKDRMRRAVVPDGKAAVTHFEVLGRYRPGYTLMKFHLETGRTHQIRVHMQAIGYPLAGDTLYKGDKGNPFHTEGQCLHAAKLGFIHPTTGEHMIFEAPLPDYFQKILAGLTPRE